MAKLVRFLVRRTTKEVFIWTEALAKGYAELEEVMAESAQAAIETKAIPDPRRISLAEIESMSKVDLLLFAKLKLNVELDAAKTRKELIGEVKVAIFTRPAEGEEIDEHTVDMTSGAAKDEGAAVNSTKPMPTAKSARSRPGA